MMRIDELFDIAYVIEEIGDQHVLYISDFAIALEGEPIFDWKREEIFGGNKWTKESLQKAADLINDHHKKEVEFFVKINDLFNPSILSSCWQQLMMNL